MKHSVEGYFERRSDYRASPPSQSGERQQVSLTNNGQRRLQNNQVNDINKERADNWHHHEGLW